MPTSRGAAAGGVYVALTMLAYGLSEALATHRVATSFDPGALLRIGVVACVFGALALVAGIAADRLQHVRTRQARNVVVAGSLVSCAGYAAFAPDSIWQFAVLVAFIALPIWRLVGREPAGLGWVAYTPLTLGMVYWLLWQFPPIASVGLLGMVWFTVNGATLLVHRALEEFEGTRARVAIAVLAGLAATIAIVSPWPLATHYVAVKIFPTATCAYAGASVIWLLLRRAPASRPLRVAAAAILAGAVTYAALLAQGRPAVFGSFPYDTMVGKVTMTVYPQVDAGDLERARRAAHPHEPTACPDTPRPRGVLWVVADALRADTFDASRFSDDVTMFTRVWTPAQSTYTSFAIWMPKMPEEVGVPWKIFTAWHDHADLGIAFGDDVDMITVGESCTDEGEKFARLTAELEPGSLAIAYMPVAHDPYHCTAPDQSPRECYENAVQCVTEQLEPVFAWARENPDWAVIVTSDHGESLGEKNVRFHSIALWEEQVRVPMLVRAPGWERGKTVETAVSNAWLSGTIGCWLKDDAAAFGGPPGVLTDSPKPAPFAVHGYSVYYGRTTWGGTRESAVVDWPWKLIVDRDTDFAQLYRLDTDPGESANVAAAHPDRVADLRATLQGLWGPPLTTRNTD